METRQSEIEFVNALEARGITLVLRRNRLNAGASQKLLTADERAYINQHRAALKELLQDPQRVQRKSMAAPVAEVVEPEPVMWDFNYERRITAEDVKAAGIPAGVTKQEAYERARQWLEDKRIETERKQQRAAMQMSYGRQPRGWQDSNFWKDVS